MSSKLQFSLQWNQDHARAWEFLLNGVKVQTPCFMPVGTKGTVKGIPLSMLNNPEYMWDNQTNIILGNTMHLHLRPGEDIIQEHWGLHTFINWNKLILTDSWGFQVFSLWLSKTKTGKPMAKVFEDYVQFMSIHDGSKHIFTPTGCIDIQRKLWSDIMMMLDVCAPVTDITKSHVEKYMKQTHRRAKEQYEYYTNSDMYNKSKWALFPIVQWWLYKDLREQSIAELSPYAKDGIGIGGLSVGETLEEMEEILAHIAPLLPKNIPRYLMGVGTPESMLLGIKYGIDMFDCVAPTRLGRHGIAYKLWGNIKLTHSKYKSDYTKWLADWCDCHTCKNYTKSYLNHLFTESEMLWGILLSLHNINYLHLLCRLEREKIIWK